MDADEIDGCTPAAADAAWVLGARLPALVLAALVAAMVAVAWGAA
jgi:hypothetical protein